ncbi:hypothetical protein ACFOWZ_20850 [Lentzea rhizosphaerae]|uniref:Secreted protein n=1 Tax=Lentzea rhizosphaerae TaxID=2041025 RepID=A0ABV8BUK7_9PSEU
MKKLRSTARASVAIAGAIVVVGLVLYLLPTGTGNRKDDKPEPGRTDLLSQVQQFSQGMSAEMGYTRPTQAERTAISTGVQRVLDNAPNEAKDVLAAVGYTISERVDTATQRTYHEISDNAGNPRGWGRIMIDTSESARLGIEVPHPKADQDSESLGVELFRKAPGSVLVVAGAHRRAAENRVADMAHTTATVFEDLHELLVRRRVPVVQLHGFQNETAPDSDVVVSAGPSLSSPSAERAAQRLESAGLSVCKPWVTGCPGLEATTNVQARYSDEQKADFVHVEVSRDIRDNPSARDQVASVLAGKKGDR